MNVFVSLRHHVRRLLTEVGRGLLPLAISYCPRLPVVDIPLHVLVSKRTADMSVAAIQSFEFFTHRRWDIIVHDDGSVTPAQRERLHRQLPLSRFVERAEADARAADCLNPLCLHLRSQHNFLMKIFDPLLISGSRAWVSLDADVFFFSPAEEITTWAEAPQTFRYMGDTKESYALPAAQIETLVGRQPTLRLNAGLCLVPAGALTLTACEEALAAMAPVAPHPMFFDQTLLALAAADGTPLPATYEISWDMWRRKGCVCRHYVGAYKDDLLYIEGVPTLLWKMTLPALWRRLNSWK